MDFYVEPPRMEIRVQQEVAEPYVVRCNQIAQTVPAAEVEARAAALDRYLADPAVAARFPKHIRWTLKPQNELRIDTGTGQSVTRNGAWTLSCPGNQLAWTTRPSQTLWLIASMTWNADTGQWDVLGIKLNSLKRVNRK